MQTHTFKFTRAIFAVVLAVVMHPADTHAASVTVSPGKSVTLSVAAAGTSPFTYQWRKDGVAISGATSATYSIASVTASHSGTYTAVVANSAGSTVSDNATLSISASAELVQLMPASYSARGQDSVAEGVAMLFDGNVNTKWLDYSPSISTWVKVGFVAPTVLSAYSLTSGNDVPYRDPASWTLSGSNDGVNWTTIEIRSGQSWGSRLLTRTFTLATPSSAYTYFRFEFVPTDGSGTQLSEIGLFGSGVAIIAPAIVTQPVSRTVSEGTSSTFTVVATGTSPNYQWFKNGVAIAGANSGSYTISSTVLGDAGSYSVVVSNSAGSATSSAATLTVNPLVVAPAITLQPVSQTVTEGGSTTFYSLASGTSPAYQWLKNGAIIFGATGSSYTIAPVALSDAGQYSLIVSNSAGSVSSVVATLAVNPLVVAPSIASQPVSQTVTEGAPVTFAVLASGTSPGYQWYKNGAAIAGATGSAYTITATTLADAATYAVVVSNSAGSVTSSGATLTVNSTMGFAELTPTSYSARGQDSVAEGVAMLFDGNVNTKWLDYSPVTTTWVKVAFASPTVLDAYSLTSANDVPYRDPKSWTLSGSNDGVTWTVIETRSGQSWPTRFLTRDFVLAQRSVAYTQFRFEFVPSDGNATQLAEIELYGATQTAVQIKPSTYNARGQANKTYAIAKLFDGNNSTKWLDNSASSWVRVGMSSATSLYSYTLTSAADSAQYDPVGWTLYGSNDGSKWTAIETRSAQAWGSRGLKREFTLATPSPKYVWFRLSFTVATGITKTHMAEAQFFGTQ